MKTKPSLFEQVIAYPNLEKACQRAARGKRNQAGVARFLADREIELLKLQSELQSDTWRPGRSRSFLIHDPKERTITAAPFRDRILHHALMNVLEPIFERRMLYDSFACRKNKGTHKALDRAQAHLRRHDWFLKLDIAQYFATIDHELASRVLSLVVKSQRLLNIFNKILEFSGDKGRGLSVGSLTSQWLANLVLDQLDHFAKEDLRIPGYVRYMDDFVLFANSRETLQNAHNLIREFLHIQLRLSLKDRATILAPARQGLPFLGWRLYRGLRRLRPENLRRSHRRLKQRRRAFETSKISEESFASSARSIFSHWSHGLPLSLRRKLAQNLN